MNPLIIIAGGFFEAFVYWVIFKGLENWQRALITAILFFIFTGVPSLGIMYSDLPVTEKTIEMVYWFITNLLALVGAAIFEALTGRQTEYCRC